MPKDPSDTDHEDPEMSPDEATRWLSEIIRSEPNLDRRPIFALDKRFRKRRGALFYELQKTERHGGRVETIRWLVTASMKHGYPTPFDRDVLYALFSLVQKGGLKPLRDPLGHSQHWLCFKTYDVARILRPGNPKNGKLYQDIKNSLGRLRGVSFESSKAFFYKPRRFWIDEWGDAFHLIDRLRWRGDPHPVTDEPCEENMLRFGDPVLENILTGYLKPLDLGYYYGLKSPVAKALYCYLSYHLYGVMRSGQACYRQNYATVCDEIMLIKQPYFSTGRKKLEPAIHQLQETGFLDPTKPWFEALEGRVDDGMLCFYLGPLAWKLCVPKDRHPLLPAPPSDPAASGQLPPAAEEPPAPPAKTAEAEEELDLASAVEYLGRLFYERLHQETGSWGKAAIGTGLSRGPGRRDRDRVRAFLEHYRVEDGEAFIAYALAQRAERWPDLATMSGALDAYGAEFVAKRQARSPRQLFPASARTSPGEAAAHQAYYTYLAAELPRLQEQFPEIYQAVCMMLYTDPRYQEIAAQRKTGMADPDVVEQLRGACLLSVLTSLGGEEALTSPIDPEYGLLSFQGFTARNR